MILDIKLIKNSSLMCVDSVLATVASWLHRRYEMMFINMIGFEFDFENAIKQDIIGSNINYGFTNNDILSMMQKYHGIILEKRTLEKDIKEIVKSEIDKNMPMICNLNGKYCPWANNHDNYLSLLLIGYDDIYFYCYDLHSNENIIRTLPISYLRENYETNVNKEYEVFLVISEEVSTISYNDLREYVCKDSYLSHNPFNKMRKLANHIEKNFNLKNEKMDFNDTYFIPICLNIMHILRARKLIATTCGLIASKNNDNKINNIGHNFLELGGEWNIIRNILVKAFLYDNIDSSIKMMMAKKIRELAANEESLLQSIVGKNTYNNKNYIISDKSNAMQPKVNIIDLKLIAHLNNKAFYDRNRLQADLTGFNEYFLEGELQKNREIITNNTSFYINNDYDNIACNKQVISIDHIKIDQLLILGCSEWGDGFGLMEITYVDDYIDNVMLEFPDWYYNKIDDLCLAWRGKAKVAIGDISERAIFCKSYQLQHNEQVKSIKLPENSNLHIFGIKMIRN